MFPVTSRTRRYDETSWEAPLSRLSLLLAASLAISAFGQTPENAAHPDQYIQQTVRGAFDASLNPTVPRPPFLAPQNTYPIAGVPGRPTQCAVPLREMKIPNGVRFATKEAPAPT